MPPVVASYLCAAFVLFLLVRDITQNREVSVALWIPLIWYMIIASRLPTEWMSGGAVVMSSGSSYVDGNPLDRNFFLILIVSGGLVLISRGISWSSLTKQNVAISLFLLFTLVSILWSDLPFVAFKRWYKVLGNVIMALVVITDADPGRALTCLMRRCAYVLIPVSVLWLKYYPELSRGFDVYTGAAVNFGITTNKNDLGNICFISGVFFTAMLFVAPRAKRLLADLNFYISLVFLVMIAWLLYWAESSTCLVSAMIGVSTIVGFRSRFIRRHFFTLVIAASLVLGLLLATTNIKDDFILALGEDTTLTGRTDLWEDLKAVDINPVIGTGFESFWLGDRLDFFWSKYWWHPNQAHNGYFEMYLNLGVIGLLFQGTLLASGYRKARRQTLIAASDFATSLARGLGEFRLAFLLGLTAYNITDATFKAVHPSFFMFFLVSLEYTAATQLAIMPVRAARLSAAVRPAYRSLKPGAARLRDDLNQELLPLTPRIDYAT